MQSRLGILLSGAYILIALYLILTQGLFGESFIALILGMPWTLLLAAIEFGGAGQTLGTVLLIIPMIMNAAILYYIGAYIDKSKNQEIQ